MRILITGATGLVGGSIVNECHARKIGVHYLTTSKKAMEDRENYRGFFWKPDEGEIDTACFEGVTAIINLAGVNIGKRWTKRRKKEILDSRLDSLKTLGKGLRKITANSVKSLVSASAVGVYPDSLTEYYSEEEQKVDDSFLGEVVTAWEQAADELAGGSLSVAKIRTGLVLSRRGGALPKLAKPVKNYVGAALGSGEQWQSWIHIQDLARIYLFAVDNKLEGVYNAVAPNPVTNNKLTREIAEVLQKPLLLPNIPEPMLRLILGEMAYMLVASQRVSSRKIEDLGYSFEHANILHALFALYEPGEPEATEDAEFHKEYNN